MSPSESERSLPPEATSTGLIVEMLVILSRLTPPVVNKVSLNCKFKLTPVAQAWTFLALGHGPRSWLTPSRRAPSALGWPARRLDLGGFSRFVTERLKFLRTVYQGVASAVPWSFYI
jgi:hypothetical protein